MINRKAEVGNIYFGLSIFAGLSLKIGLLNLHNYSSRNLATPSVFVITEGSEPDASLDAEKCCGLASFLEDNRDQIPVSFESSVLFGHAAERIISYAEMESFDLIIIGTHGHKGLEKMLFGSVAEKVVKLAPCPVLTINTYRHDEEER